MDSREMTTGEMSPSESASGEAVAVESQGGPRVRLSGCSPAIEKIVSTVLHYAGFDAVSADSDFDGVNVLDVSHPNTEGVTEYLDSLPDETAVLLLCLERATTDPSVRDHARVTTVLSKPFSPVDLRDALYQLTPPAHEVGEDGWVLSPITDSERSIDITDEVDVVPDGASDPELHEIPTPPPAAPDLGADRQSTYDRGAVNTDSVPDIWLALATEIANMLPVWSSLPSLQHRAAAIADWLEAKLSDSLD